MSIIRYKTVKYFLLFLFLPWFLINSTLAAKIAQVIIPKAIVYSDEALTIPIGHVSKGKLIPVGNPLKHNIEIVPVVIAGKLAFVHIQDIRFVSQNDEELEKRKNAPSEHNIDQEFMTVEEKLSENNYMSLSYGMMSVGNDIQEFFRQADGREQTNFNRFIIDVYHRSSYTPITWGVSFEYLRVAGSNASIDSLLISPQVAYSLLTLKKINFEVFSSLNLGAGNTIKIENNFANEPRGWLLGFDLGSRVSFPLSKKWSATGSITYRRLKAFDITNIEYENGNIGEIKSVNSTGFSVGFSYAL